VTTWLAKRFSRTFFEVRIDIGLELQSQIQFPRDLRTDPIVDRDNIFTRNNPKQD
jgi:hypothetical protein